MACEGAEVGGTLDAGRTPRVPLPVPWPAGCGGISVFAPSGWAPSGLATSVLLISALLVSAALTTNAVDVSGTSGRPGRIALVMAGAGWFGPAEASFICPALTWTVFTLTGFIGSDEPGIAAICCVWITPLVSGAGSAFACGGGTAAVAAAMTDGRVTGAAERSAAVAGSDSAA